MKKNTSLVFRRAEPSEADAVKEFINSNFDIRLPLINLPEYFEFYYHPLDQLQFVLAEDQGKIVSAAGYIRTSRESCEDIWVSIWVARKGYNGAGLELMNNIASLTGSSRVSCNNIRPQTCVFYRFLGWYADGLPHYFRQAPIEKPRLIKSNKPILPVLDSGYTLKLVNSQDELAALGLPSQSMRPEKDIWYLSRRYFCFPHKEYSVYAVFDENKNTAGYLAVNYAQAFFEEETEVKIPVMRIVDFIGAPETFGRIGKAINDLILENGCEYADCYCYGIPESAFNEAGFRLRDPEDSSTLVPNYLCPIALQNTDYYFFTSDTEKFSMFKADGDQDRPNISC